MAKRETKICCTGMTDEEHREWTREWETNGTYGTQRCYLCRRPEGTTSVQAFSDSSKPFSPTSFVTRKVSLSLISRPITEDLFFAYLLCTECALLVGLEVEALFPGKRAADDDPPPKKQSPQPRHLRLVKPQKAEGERRGDS